MDFPENSSTNSINPKFAKVEREFLMKDFGKSKTPKLLSDMIR